MCAPVFCGGGRACVPAPTQDIMPCCIIFPLDFPICPTNFEHIHADLRK